jgi:hypothetical protein
MKSKFKFAAVAVALLASSHLAIAEDKAPEAAKESAPAAAAEPAPAPESAPAAAADQSTAPAAAPDTDAKAKGDADMKAAMQGEMERQLFVGMVALKDYCKTTDAEHAKGYDESWDKNTADAPAELKALQATADFANKVAARVKDMTVSSKATTTATEELKGACAKILATK